ncbi:hypothetical protein, partial [Mycobacterium tuberculosis]
RNDHTGACEDPSPRMRANGVFGLLAAAACGVPIPVIDNRAEEMTGRHATTATSFSITDQSCAS